MNLHEKPTDRFVDAGAGFLALAAFLLCTLYRLPFAAEWCANTAVFTGMFAGMTLYKRNPWGWAGTLYVAAVSVTVGIFNLTGGAAPGGGKSAAAWIMGGLIVPAWLCMLRLERNRKADPLPVQHIVNHYVFHGLPAGAEALPPVPGEVMQVPHLPGIAAPRRPLAIGAPRRQDNLAQRLAAKVPVRLVRRA